MRLRNKPWAKGELERCSYYMPDDSPCKGKWQSIFPNSAPIMLEIGCGKGLWIAGAAPSHRELNFVGADIKSLMLAYAVRNLDSAYPEAADNVRLLSADAERISNYFAPEDGVRCVVINFCNPWPKPHHHKRRLIHPRQLEQYRGFLGPQGEILFKTDDDHLYAAAQDYFAQAGFEIAEDIPDLYSVREMDPAVMTEHEAKFTSMGLPIHFIRAVMKQ